MRLFGLVLLAIGLTVTPLRAQAPVYQPTTAVARALLLVSPNTSPAPDPTARRDAFPERRFSSRAPGATLMIIGGAGIVAGILVGGSGGAILILGGVGLGAYGLYLYTR